LDAADRITETESESFQSLFTLEIGTEKCHAMNFEKKNPCNARKNKFH
jgi:hypothetical protein